MGELGWEQGIDELLRVVQRRASPADVLDWLGRRTATAVAWVCPGGRIEAATDGFPHEAVEALGERLVRLADGRLGAATARHGDLEVHLEACGRQAPRPVLVTVGAAGRSREAAALVSRAGGLLHLLGEARRADHSARGYEEKARALRFAVLTALMTGDVILARRMTHRDVPPLLDAERVRVHLLHCPPADRDRLASAFQDASGYHGVGLMVHCPAFLDHLICPIAERERDGEGSGGLDDRLAGVLRRLVRENRGYALGVSRPHPIAATAAAYGEAVHALAVARNSPERLAVYHGSPSLLPLLPRPAALSWARAHVEPLLGEAKITQDVTRLAVAFPRSAVARLLGISRTTVTAHCGRAERALQADLGEVRVRAALDLALALASNALPSEPGAEAAASGAPSLAHLLSSEPAVDWATGFLEPLGEAAHRDLHATLRTWVGHNTDAQRAAEALSVSRNTVRARLRTAERLLNRDLLTTGSGLHDIVHALIATDHRAHLSDRSGHCAPWSRRGSAP
ncbi:helix-turn-helix domain-containing protein [Streptomyces sp. AK04-3B]|uniref:helix-turn-helix domain-containing protein n=1 Tax=Streptomyces sp. AK04-3B TaxID=3028650 RepID=UPI0029A8936B|nr:helix-turn-helix domain-containing protein [Streptomyces sp. AK04-3B]MDX3801913.1 helix-turn-helix domain-containing protein [Streptomyces sp. AK04-3B]